MLGRVLRLLERFETLDVKAARIWLLIAVSLLVCVGLVTVFSSTSASLTSAGASPYDDVVKQLAYTVVGVGIMLAIVLFFSVQSVLGLPLLIYYGACMVMLVLTFAIGTEVNGAKRWLYLGSVGFQPSEFAKVALLLMMVRILYDHQTGKLRWRAAMTHFIVLIVVPLIFLYATQSDLGTTAICIVGIYAAFWLSGASRNMLMAVAAILGVAAFIAIFGVGYRSSRMVFFDPWGDGMNGLGDGYNIKHSYYAISGGGLFGVGLGSSHEKYGYLFASDSDFIFAIIAEEMGFVGAMAVVCLFLVVLFSGMSIANSAGGELGRMVAGSLAIMLVFQAFLNIGCAVGVFPTTGKPLPFISSGGTSVISSLMIVGILLVVAREGVDSADPRKRRDGIRVVRTGGPAPNGRV